MWICIAVDPRTIPGDPLPIKTLVNIERDVISLLILIFSITLIHIHFVS